MSEEIRDSGGSTDISTSQETLETVVERPLTPGVPLRRTIKASDISFQFESQLSLGKKIHAWNNNNNPDFPAAPVVANVEEVPETHHANPPAELSDSYSDSNSTLSGSNKGSKAGSKKGKEKHVPAAPVSVILPVAPKPAPAPAVTPVPPPASVAGSTATLNPVPGKPPSSIGPPASLQSTSIVPSIVPPSGDGDGVNQKKGKKGRSKAKVFKKEGHSKPRKSKGSTELSTAAYPFEGEPTITNDYDYEATSYDKTNSGSTGRKKEKDHSGEVCMSQGMGAISFKVPGKITHKTTIKIAHYPQTGCEIGKKAPPPYDCEELVIHENGAACNSGAACNPEPAKPAQAGCCGPVPVPGMPCGDAAGCFPLPSGNYSNNCNYYTTLASETAKQLQQQQQQYQMYQQQQYQLYQQQQQQAMYNPYGGSYGPYCYR